MKKKEKKKEKINKKRKECVKRNTALYAIKY